MNATYTIYLQDSGSPDLRAEYPYTDDLYFDAFNNDSTKQEGYSLTNLRVIWDAREQWSVQAFVENVADKNYTVSRPYPG